MGRRYSDRIDKNCWEFNNCPEQKCRTCPAHPDHGKECWKVTGTLCAGGGEKKQTLSEKILYCRNECTFYKTYFR